MPALPEAVCVCEKVTPQLHCTAAITANRSLPILTFTQLAFFRYQSATLCAAPALYNPHSRNGTAAPRFSPTRSFDEAQDRFILPSFLRHFLWSLIAFRLWG
jgi:hypothetical protein